MNGHWINWFGHVCGALLFALLLGLLWRDRSPGRVRAIFAALLAFVWNGAGVLALNLGREPWIEALESVSFSLLPAVLFDLMMPSGARRAVAIGYVCSVSAALAHVMEAIYPAGGAHLIGIYIAVIGFGGMAMYAWLRTKRRSASAAAILLLALSLLHFTDLDGHAEPLAEILIHHAGIPLAMFLLLQDYRSVFLDAVIRFVANILLAIGFAAALGLALRMGKSQGELATAAEWAATTTALILYAAVRARLQGALTNLVFRHGDLQSLVAGLRQSAGSEAAYLQAAEEKLQAFFDASADTTAVMEVPVRLGSGEMRSLRLGRRAGGRPYLSEDLEAIRVAAGAVQETLVLMREEEMRRLVAQAELHALQAQINPHFLFNALNTVYGLIPRQAQAARRTVLNLADLFRYFLEVPHGYVPLEEEVRIVRAYLEIESVRLGSKLRTEIDVAPEALSIPIPLLTIEPLVENAVKHGIARRPEGGSVVLRVTREPERVTVVVSDSGGVFHAEEGKGVGLANVRRRLALCYGAAADLTIRSSDDATEVRFHIPVTA
jgi:hypothetical protein